MVPENCLPSLNEPVSAILHLCQALKIINAILPAKMIHNFITTLKTAVPFVFKEMSSLMPVKIPDIKPV